MSRVHEFEAPMGTEVATVQYMPISETVADVFMRKDIEIATRTDYKLDDNGENQPYEYEYQKGLEVYYQVNPTRVSLDDIQNNFDKYWAYANQWIDARNMTDKEHIAILEAENARLKQCVIELSESL